MLSTRVKEEEGESQYQHWTQQGRRPRRERQRSKGSFLRRTGKFNAYRALTRNGIVHPAVTVSVRQVERLEQERPARAAPVISGHRQQNKKEGTRQWSLLAYPVGVRVAGKEDGIIDSVLVEMVERPSPVRRIAKINWVSAWDHQICKRQRPKKWEAASPIPSVQINSLLEVVIWITEKGTVDLLNIHREPRKRERGRTLFVKR
jgi:hypothetical protein